MSFSRTRPSLWRHSVIRDLSSSPAWAGSRRIQVDMTGTRELDRKYDAAIANPTASDRGTNRLRATPVMKNDGTNTDRTHNIASKRGITTSRLASRTARACGTPWARWVWMFSIATVASSTRIPTASARPPSVIVLIVCPAPHNATTAVSNANGIVVTTMAELRTSLRKSNTISPVSNAPRTPSRTKDESAFFTYVD